MNTYTDFIILSNLFSGVLIENWLGNENEQDIAAYIQKAFLGSQANSTQIAKVGDLRDINEAAEIWAKKRAGELISQISKEHKKVIQQIIARGIQQGKSDEEIAKLISKRIGLTPRYTEAVENYRLGLIEKGFSHSESARKSEQYAERLRNRRALDIAKTEVQAALNQGQIFVWKSMMELGDLPVDVERRWVLHKDEKLCPICKGMNGKKIPFNGAWSIGKTKYSSPPIHPLCRCTEEIVRNGRKL